MSDQDARADRPVEGEQLPEEAPQGHPHTDSSPAERKRKAGVGDEDRDAREAPATGEPRDARD